MENLLLTTLLFSSVLGWTQNQAPDISNLSLSMTGDNTLTITYDLSDAENDACFVSLYISNDNGTTYQVDASGAEGDVNALISVGNNKSISWNYTETPSADGSYQVKIVADDQQIIDIQGVVDQVDQANLLSKLTFVEGIRHRNTGLNHLLEVREFIDNQFVDFGLNAENTTFDYQGFLAKNYISKIEGTDSDGEIYILCGHYDTVSNSPGADDNGTSVVGMLEAARILSQYNFKKTIKFISFDLEELGLVGSTNYVNNNLMDTETINGILNFEMIGYATEEPNTQSLPTGFNLLFPEAYNEVESQGFRGNFIINVGKANQNDWEDAFSEAADAYVPNLRVITIAAPANWQTLTPDLGRSDHAPFWVAGHPAVMLSGTANFRNPNYHTPGDTIGTINFNFMSNVVKATVGTLAEQAGIQHSDWAVASIQVTAVEAIFSKEILIFPNPSKQIIHLNTKFGDIESVSFMNTSGKVVLKADNPIESIDISTLNSGFYQVFIHSKEKTFINKLVVVE